MHFEPRFHTLVEVLEKSTQEFGSRPLIGTKNGGQWSWMTYADFSKEVARLRAALASRGVSRGDRVAIISNNRAEWAAAAYATYSTGAAFVPMYEAQHPKEWEFIVNDCGAKVLFIANDAAMAKAKPFFSRAPALKHVVLLDGQTNGQTGDDPRIETYANSDGWFDDISDGPVMARLVMMEERVQKREVLRLHQFHRLSYEAAGTLATLDLPADSPAAYAEELVA